MKHVICLAVALAIAAPLAAQQLEPNTPGGSLTINGNGPTGYLSPIAIQFNDSVAIETSGAAGAPYTLLYGALLPTSISFGSEILDIDPVTAGGVVDGLGLGYGGGLPPFFGFLNATGVATLGFSLNAAAIGQTVAMQAAVLDPGAALGLNLSGAPEFNVIPIPPVSTTLVGDDVLGTYALAAPLSLYGQATQDVQVSTNGYILFGNGGTFGDLSESVTELLAGTAGGAPGGQPMVAVLWEDIDMGNGVPGQQVDILELGPGLLSVSWTNGDYFPTTPFGTVSCLIDNATDSVTWDFSLYTNAAPPTEGLVGISDGGSASAVGVEIDLASGGSIGYGAGNPVEAVYQDFAVGAFPEPMDLGGLVMTCIGTSTGSLIFF